MKTNIIASSLDSTQLSTKKTVRDWKVIQPQLKAGATPDVWKGVLNDYYIDRLQSRYFAPIQAISAKRKLAGEGFSIVAIQCSLIEFLEGCFEGKNYVYKNPQPPDEYNGSKEVFVHFLTTRDPFQAAFINPSLAEDFYSFVRCGVLHEACTNGGWRIHADSGSSIIVDPIRRILYRDDFQSALKTFIKNYCKQVPSDPTRQQAFVRKYDHLSK